MASDGDPNAWLGLLKWSLAHQDGTEPSDARPMADEVGSYNKYGSPATMKPYIHGVEVVRSRAWDTDGLPLEATIPTLASVVAHTTSLPHCKSCIDMLCVSMYA